MVQTELPEFGPLRADLTRLFVQHKADRGLDDEPDDYIAAHVDDIAAIQIGLCPVAIAQDDQNWLARHEWWREDTQRLLSDQAAAPVDS